MQWHEIRNQYPDQWLVVEALDAHTEGDQRRLNQLSVIGTFGDSADALRKYQAVHQESPDRELYVFHSSREVLQVTEQSWLGIRL